MSRKEHLYAVIGGVVGAVLTMAVGSFSPLGAQDEAVNLTSVDLDVREITCKDLKVVDETGNTRVWLGGNMDDGWVHVYSDNARVMLRATEHGSAVSVAGSDGKPLASMMYGLNTATLRISDKDGQTLAHVSSMDNGGVVGVYGNDGNLHASMGVVEDGGSISVHGRNGKARAAMSVLQTGNGAVMTLDKNGNFLAGLE